MPTTFKAYVVKEAVAIAALNATINTAYTWWLWLNLDPMPLLGEGAIGRDLALTPVVIALLSTLIGTGLVRRKIGDGRTSVSPDTHAPAPMRLLPRGVWARSAALAAASALLLALPLWLLLPLGGDGLLTPLQASGTKALLTVALSLLIVPVVTMAALADVRRSTAKSVPA